MCLFTLICGHKSTVFCFFVFFFLRLDETPQPMEVNGSQPTAPEGSETGTQDVKVSQLILIDDKVYAPCNGIWIPESSKDLQ